MNSNLIIKRLLPKRKRIVFFLLLVTFFVFLHFFLQFRTSDWKTEKIFKRADVLVSINYMPSETANAKVRIISTDNKKDLSILFIHGAPGSADTFYEFLKDTTLLQKATLITYDRPGYGYSNFGNAMPSLEKQAMVVNEISAFMGLKNVILVGHSYGGPIAAHAALLTDKLHGLVLLSPAINPDSEKYSWTGKLSEWKITRWIIPPAFVVGADEKRTYGEQLIALKDKWKAIKTPTLIIHGKKDILAPFENMQFVKTHFPDSILKTIALPDENHFIPWTKKQLIVNEIIELVETAQFQY